jgi:hypothetical protein
MKKRVVDLDFDQLSALAEAAGAEAVRATLAAGVPVTGMLGDTPGVSTLYPDGSLETLDFLKNPRPAISGKRQPSRRKTRVA